MMNADNLESDDGDGMSALERDMENMINTTEKEREKDKQIDNFDDINNLEKEMDKDLPEMGEHE